MKQKILDLKIDIKYKGIIWEKFQTLQHYYTSMFLHINLLADVLYL